MSEPVPPTDTPPPGSVDPRILLTVATVILLAAAVTILITGALNSGQRPAAVSPAATVPAATQNPAAALPTTPPSNAAPAADAGHALPDDIDLELITVAEAGRRLAADTALFVDMREGAQYQAGHIPGALALFSDELQSRMSNLPQDSVIIAYSDASRPDAGRRGAAILVQLGFPRVYLLDGGLEAWSAAALPLAQP